MRSSHAPSPPHHTRNMSDKSQLADEAMQKIDTMLKKEAGMPAAFVGLRRASSLCASQRRAPRLQRRRASGRARYSVPSSRLWMSLGP
jgi:hypothetical protein